MTQHVPPWATSPVHSRLSVRARLLLGAALLVSPLVLASAARATPVLSLTLSESGYTALSDSSTNGVINFSATNYGTFSTISGTAAGVPAIGTANQPQIDLSSLNIAGATGTLTMTLTETGLAIGSPATVSGNIGGTNAGPIAEQQSIYASANGGASYTEIASSGVLSSASFASDISGAFTFSGNDALREVITIAASGGAANSSFDAHESVPEPGALALLGTGLALLGTLRPRRKRALA
jgi:hypothetical protein